MITDTQILNLILKYVDAQLDDSSVTEQKDYNANYAIGRTHAFTAVKDMIVNPMFIETHRLAEFNPRGTDVPVVLYLMIHDIDIVFNVLYKLVSGDYELNSAGNNDLCKVLIKFDSSIVSLSASRKASKKIRAIYIEEEEFTIEGDLMNKEI